MFRFLKNHSKQFWQEFFLLISGVVFPLTAATTDEFEFSHFWNIFQNNFCRKFKFCPALYWNNLDSRSVFNLLFFIPGVVFPLPSVAASAATTATLAQQPPQPQTPASNNSEQLHLQSSNKKLSHSLDHLNSSSSQVAMWRSEMEVHNWFFFLSYSLN